MSTYEKSVEFALGGHAVRLTLAGDRWVARVDESVAIASTARLALTAALEPLTGASMTLKVLLADLGLLEPSVAVARIEAEATSA
jgi:hypothetical protein